jgi:subtilisin-like proprotein convertase family protein/subtilisin family serine protease
MFKADVIEARLEVPPTCVVTRRNTRLALCFLSGWTNHSFSVVSPVKTLRAVPFLASLFLADAFAGPLKDSYRLRDHGQPREFEVALDEIHKGRRAQRIERKANAEETRRTARENAADIVLYEKGQPRNDASRRIVTRRIVVQVTQGSDPVAIAARVGAQLIGAAPGGKADWYILESALDPGSALEAVKLLENTPDVISAEPLLARQQSRRTIPNDPLFSLQWHLDPNSNFDLNVAGVWDNYRGRGVTIGIIDDGLEWTHPDLQPAYISSLSFDFNGRDADPLPPSFFGDDHGTSCAGVAAARGNNGLGVTGVAFEAFLSGIRLISAPATDAEEAEAFALKNDFIHIKSNSWGPFDDARRLEGPGPLATAALENGVKEGRGGLGTIYIWAGGNGGEEGDSSSFDGYASSRYTLAVGAVTDRGERADYSEPGTNVLISAPSSGGDRDVATTDRQGEDGYNVDGRDFDGFPDVSNPDYTETFGGTSAAAPMVAGAVALMLEARPQLGWRDVKEILLRSARMVNSSDRGWVTNSAGFHFNDAYGAGLIDVLAAVNLAKNWTLLAPEIFVSSEQQHLAQPIPDNDITGVEKTFVLTQDQFRIEHTCVTVDILHASRGQLEITLESPGGTVSRMVPVRRRDSGDHFLNWTFMSTHHWGESAGGTWKVRVVDRVRGTTGTLRGLKLEFFGTSQEGHFKRENTILQAEQIVDGFVNPGEAVTIAFTVRNEGESATNNITATLLPTGGVSNPSGAVNMGSTGAGNVASPAFTFIASGTLGQTIYATLRLQESDKEIGTVVFPIVLGKIGTVTVSSPTAIEIPRNFSRKPGTASDYPSSVDVVDVPLGAVVTDVVMRLNHIMHRRSRDLDLLLVGPGGQRMIPMSDVGGEEAFDVDLVLSDSAPQTMPGTAPLFSGTYKPTNHDAQIDRFPKPASAKPYDANFAVFAQSPAAGQWNLFVRDDASGSSGALGGWSLEITYAY